MRLVSDVSVEELEDEAAIGQASKDSLLRSTHQCISYRPDGAENWDIDEIRFIAGKKKNLGLLAFGYFTCCVYFWTRSGSIAGSPKSRSD